MLPAIRGLAGDHKGEADRVTSCEDTAWAGEDASWAEGHRWTSVSPVGGQGLAHGKEEPVKQGCAEGAGPAFKELPG